MPSVGDAPNDAAPLATIDDHCSRHTARAAGPPGTQERAHDAEKKGKFWYGTTQEDLRTEMRRYSADNVYEATYAAWPSLAAAARDLHAGH